MRIKSPQENRLNQLRLIYILYGFVDGLNLSYSVLKYFFDLVATKNNKNANNLMHNWLLSPEGIAGFVFTGVLVIFSIFGNVFKDSDKNFFKKYTAKLWPYVRDVIKSTKNAYKGVRSTLSMMHQLGFFSYTNLFLLGAAGVFGAISIVTRLGLRAFRNDRKSRQTKNQALAEELLGCAYECYPNGLPSDPNEWPHNTYVLIGDQSSRTPILKYINSEGKEEDVDDNAVNVDQLRVASEIKDNQLRRISIRGLLEKDPERDVRFIWSQKRLDGFRKNIQTQTKRQQAYGYVASGVAGFIDGMYLYMGLYALTVLVPPAFIVISVFSSLCLLTSILTRIYEEHEYQVRLDLSVVTVEQVTCKKQREAASKAIMLYCMSLEDVIPNPAEPSSKDNDLVQKVWQKVALYQKSQKEYEKAILEEKRLQRLHTVSAILFGLKNGITVYGVLAAGLFAIGAIFTLASIAFPPVLVLVGVALGLVCLVSFTAYAVYENKKKQAAIDKRHQQQNSTVTPEYQKYFNQLVVLDFKSTQPDDIYLQMIAIKKCVGSSVQQSLDGDQAVDSTEQAIKEMTKNKKLLNTFGGVMSNEMDPNAGPRLTDDNASTLRTVSEVFRSIFSGCTKGVKNIALLFNGLLNLDESGNNHDSMVTLILTGVATAINVVVLGARAWAKGFGLEWVKKAPQPQDAGASSSPTGSQIVSSTASAENETRPPHVLSKLLLSGHSAANQSALMVDKFSSGIPVKKTPSPTGSQIASYQSAPVGVSLGGLFKSPPKKKIQKSLNSAYINDTDSGVELPSWHISRS